MTLAQKYDGRALITGSARGIGAAFAEVLAAEGFDLLMVDTLSAENAHIAHTVAERHGVSAEPITFDLTGDDVEQVAQRWAQEHEVGVLVSNAGISQLGEFLDIDVEAHRRTLDLNCRATLVLTHVFGRQMRARGRGAIVIVSSQSCIVGAPFAANYAGTKAFGLNLALGLHHELGPYGVDVLGLCPGLTETPSLAAHGVDPSAARFVSVSTPSVVADKALRALGRQPYLLPSWKDRWSTRFLNALPRRSALALVGGSMRKLLTGAPADRSGDSRTL